MKRPQSDMFPDEREASRAKTASSDGMAVDRKPVGTNAAFIACPENAQDFEINRDRRNFIQAVRNAIEAGADIINISFSRTASRDATDTIAKILPELTSIFDAEWVSSFAQPAYSCRTVGSVMSFFSNSRANLLSEAFLDPEEGLPAILLTFSIPEGHLCTITTSLPTLPRTTRARLLKAYASAAANTKAETILIGCACADAVLFMENQTAKLIVEFELFTNANLCLLANCSDRTSAQCIALDTEAPFSLIALVDRTKNRPDKLSPDTDASSAQGSAERPAPDHGRCSHSLPRPAITLRPATPLYDKLIADLEKAADQHPEGHAFVDYITKSCFFGSLVTMDFFGQPLEKPLPLAVKMEELLQAAWRQRQLQVDRLRRSTGRRVDTHMRMGNNDMKQTYNEWRAHPEEWMQMSTLQVYKDMQRSGQKQKAHQLAKSRFSTFLFHLSGCKFLLQKLIEPPLIPQIFSSSVEQPVATVLMDLISSYEEHKTTEQYQEVVRNSQKQQERQKRLSHELWWAQYHYTKGRFLATKVKDGMLKFDDLDSKEQELVEAFETRRSAKALDRLLHQKRPPYRGVGPEIET